MAMILPVTYVFVHIQIYMANTSKCWKISVLGRQVFKGCSDFTKLGNGHQSCLGYIAHYTNVCLKNSG